MHLQYVSYIETTTEIASWHANGKMQEECKSLALGLSKMFKERVETRPPCHGTDRNQEAYVDRDANKLPDELGKQEADEHVCTQSSRSQAVWATSRFSESLLFPLSRLSSLADLFHDRAGLLAADALV